MMHKTRYQERLHKLQELLKVFGCDALLIEDQVNLYYLTGMELSAGKLIVGKEGLHLLVDARYFELCQKRSPIPVILSDQTSFAKMLLQDDFSSIKTLGFDSGNTTYSAFTELQKMTEKMRLDPQRARELSLCPVNSPLKSLRMIKDPDELAILREAALLGSEGYDYVLTLLKEGITEIEVATELEIFWKRRGSKGLAFDPIIAFGPNSSMPHYRAGNAALKRGQCVLIDIGVNFKHYHSDMTRMAFFGEADPKIMEIYGVVKKAQAAALALCRPGMLVGDLDKAARDVIASHGYSEHFTHSLGHGVGLEIHEYPSVSNKPPANGVALQAGMVITIEPGIYLKDIGGVRLEDTIAITDGVAGYENLTQRGL